MQLTSANREEIILAEVHEIGLASAAQIAREVQMSESTVRHILRRLEKSGRVCSAAYQRRARLWMPTIYKL